LPPPEEIVSINTLSDGGNNCNINPLKLTA
jgi:hypothetical protein